MKFLVRTVTAVAATMLVPIAFAVPVSAATTVHSPTQAGYTATSAMPITSFRGSLTVPTITCPSVGSIAMAAQITFVSPGVATTPGLSWSAFCSNGSVRYNVAQADLGTAAGIVVIAPGDVVKFALSATATTLSVSVTNTRTLQRASASGPAGLPLTGIQATTQVEDFSHPGSNVSPIPSFAPAIKFAALTVNGAPLGSLTPTKYAMYNGTTLQITTSSISANGTFSTTFVHV